MRRIVDIGVLQSQSGMYSVLSQASRTGVLQGVAEVNASQALDVGFRVSERDPAGLLERYAPLCRDLLCNTRAQHIFGCVTSASRKEVIPELERFGGTLWYPVPYEGFEASEHVAYMHSCPNQHLLPLLDWAMLNLGQRAYFIGSNYIWGWEMAQIARAEITGSGGQVLGDRYIAVGTTELDHILHEIRALRPDFVLNSLIGESSYAFLKQLHSTVETQAPIPVLSCNFTESELDATENAAEGLIAAGPWFEPGEGRLGSFAEMARQSVHELARLLNGRPGAERLSLSELLRLDMHDGISARLHHDNLHARQPVIIARLESGRFRPLHCLPEREADPYLTGHHERKRPNHALRVVS